MDHFVVWILHHCDCDNLPDSDCHMGVSEKERIQFFDE
jgi:hypothetical protein